MKMTYTDAERAYLAAKGYATRQDEWTDLRIKEYRAAAKRGMTVDEMRAQLARKNRLESLTIKKARLERRLAQVTAELAELQG